MSKRFVVIAIFIIASAIVGGTFGSGMRGYGSSAMQGNLPGAVDQSASVVNTSFSRNNNAIASVEQAYQAAVEVVSNNYGGEVDYEKMNQAAIQGMLSALDPHSAFFPRPEFTKLREDQDSRFYGIGVNILRHHDGVYVQSPVDNTPAARSGLRYGDRIVEVDGKDARDWTGEQVSKNVRGARGEPVTIKIERAGALAPLYFTIVRDAVPLPSIRNAFMVNPGTGYIGLQGGFTHTTGDELRRAVGALKKENLRQLVLDLRNNPGGLLDQAITVAGQFLPRDHTIVSVRGREYEQPRIYKNNEVDPEDFPLVVLINRNSASASEIVAGAIQDHGRGLVVGETSFGKGLVQRVFQLPFGTGLTLTTAKYYTPFGRLIQRDYTNGSLYDYYVRHDPEDDAQPTQPSRSASPTSSTVPTQPTLAGPAAEPTPTPVPTGPAIRTAAGRVFYGGGGITPDVEVKPLDASPLRARISEAAFYFTRELAAGKLPGLENYRVEQVQYGRFPRSTDFAVTDRVLEAFRNYLRRSPELQLTSAQADTDSEFARLRIRTEVVTAAYGNEAGGRILLESDPQLGRSLEALPEAKRLAESIRRGTALS
ncbi:MAG: S41 family peptidase [Pyrinomonadaceae bacterium]|nr:S41 family peptidase [Pyrinomonadaceae bacterium]